jgi:hypothetical protein
MVAVEHPEVAGESLHSHLGGGLADHRLEKIVCFVDAALGVGGRPPAELVGDVGQRTLEVRRHLARVVAGGAPSHAVPLDEHHAPGARTQNEERGGDARDPCPDDDNVGRPIGIECARRPVGRQLGKPRGPIREIRVRGFGDPRRSTTQNLGHAPHVELAPSPRQRKSQLTRAQPVDYPRKRDASRVRARPEAKPEFDSGRLRAHLSLLAGASSSSRGTG